MAQTHSKLQDPVFFTALKLSEGLSAFVVSNSSSEYSSRRTELLVTLELDDNFSEILVALDALAEILDDLLGETASIVSASSSISASSENSMFSFFTDDFDLRELTEIFSVISEFS